MTFVTYEYLFYMLKSEMSKYISSFAFEQNILLADAPSDNHPPVMACRLAYLFIGVCL